MLVFLPSKKVDQYVLYIEKIFGENSVTALSIRRVGAVCVNYFNLISIILKWLNYVVFGIQMIN